jgi:hypothetical protein
MRQAVPRFPVAENLHPLRWPNVVELMKSPHPLFLLLAQLYLVSWGGGIEIVS